MFLINEVPLYGSDLASELVEAEEGVRQERVEERRPPPLCVCVYVFISQNVFMN